MLRKLTSALLVASLLVMIVPFTVTATAQIPAFTGFATTETTIAAGEEIIFTISTLAAVTHVFTEVDGTRVNAVQIARPAPAAGTRNWRLAFAPDETQTITVYANTANRTQGAAVISIPVTVEGSLPGVVTINSVRRNVTDIFAGDPVTFTITTSEAAEYVFTQADGRWVRATLTQTNATTGEKTWQLTVRPGVTQDLNIYANTEYVRGAVSSRQTVVVQRIPLFTEVLQPYEVSHNRSWNVVNYAHVTSVTVAGRSYGSAISMTFYDSGQHPFGLYNLDGQFTTITGIVGRVSGSDRNDAILNFIGDGRVIESFSLRVDDMPREVTINVRGVRQLRIELLPAAARATGFGPNTFVFAEATIR
jgi:hypothetical protein